MFEQQITSGCYVLFFDLSNQGFVLLIVDQNHFVCGCFSQNNCKFYKHCVNWLQNKPNECVSSF